MWNVTFETIVSSFQTMFLNGIFLVIPEKNHRSIMLFSVEWIYILYENNFSQIKIGTCRCENLLNRLLFFQYVAAMISLWFWKNNFVSVPIVTLRYFLDVTMVKQNCYYSFQGEEMWVLLWMPECMTDYICPILNVPS